MNFGKNREVAYSPWTSKFWEELYIKAERRLSKERIYTLGSFLQHSICHSGDVIEMGVYKGCTAYVLGSLLNFWEESKTLYLCDTFTGTPNRFDKSKGDINREGKYSDTSVEYVSAKMEKCYSKCCMIKGFIPNSLGEIGDDVQFCFAHLHLNLYESTKNAIIWLKDRLNKEGVIVVEDYGIRDCMGVRKAVDELVEENIVELIYLPTGQGILNFKR